MSKTLPRLLSGWAVDQSIVTEKDRVVVIRFGSEDDLATLEMDKSLIKIQDLVRNFAVIYCLDKDEVKDFNVMYELTAPTTLMFFYRNSHIQVDTGTGDNNKITKSNIPKEHFIDIIEEVYNAASKGRGAVTSMHDYSKGMSF